jgi:hypothetical protein
MHWLLQQNALTRELDLFETITRTLDAGSVPWTPVRALSFTDKIVAVDEDVNGKELDDIPDLDISIEGPIMVYGSYTLALIAAKKKWTPGAFVNENFTHDALANGWGKERMLNGDALICRLDEIQGALHGRENVFLRPFEDTKSFSGMVQSRDEALWWAENVVKANGTMLNSNTKIVVASTRTIIAEYRLFVVDGRVVTSSLYKLGNSVILDTYTPPQVLDYAKRCIELWVPDRAFVLDLAETPEGIRIIEVNNINSSGVYAANVSLLIQELDAMLF